MGYTNSDRYKFRHAAKAAGMSESQVRAEALRLVKRNGAEQKQIATRLMRDERI